jgi:probable rRNA maturation factor
VELKRHLKRILNDLASKHPEVTERELSIVFCDDSFIHELNRSYRNKDKPTDVLSFSARDETTDFIEGDSLGDLVISIPTTFAQARRYRVTRQQELARLLIHGTLHLFGYDHEKVAKSVAAKMRREEERLLTLWGAEIVT